ncbi:MAG: ROK family protein [Terriglobales bacterium]
MTDNNARLLLRKSPGVRGRWLTFSLNSKRRSYEIQEARNIFGAIEGGGTKFICAVGNGPDDLTLTQFPTEAARADDCARSCISAGRAGTRLQAVGIGSFGPVDLSASSPTFGYITSTPKPGWQNYDFAGTVRKALRVPVGFDTDVDAAALMRDGKSGSCRSPVMAFLSRIPSAQNKNIHL